MLKKSICSLAVACVLSPAQQVLANDAANAVDVTDPEVIVVIGKSPRKVQDVVGSVTVINNAQIERQLVHDVASLMKYQVGINVKNSGNRFGDSEIAIRGISGNRITTEIDGIPVADQFDVGSYSNSSKNHIDPEIIKQVEILRGPASSIYGSDAIGGVVSFITKSPADLLSQTDKDYFISLKTGYYGIDDSKAIAVNTAFAKDKSSFLLSATTREGHQLDRNLRKEAKQDHQDTNTDSLLAKYVYEISDLQEITFTYDYFNNNSESDIRSSLGQGRFQSTYLLLADDESQRSSISATYDFVTDSDWLTGGSLRVFNQETETEQLTQEARNSRGKDYLYHRNFYFEQEINGVRLNLYTDLNSGFVSQHIGYGIEYSKTKSTELRDALQTNRDTGASTNIVLSEVFPLRDFPITSVKEFGLYLNNEINFDDLNITIIPAIRYDNYKLTPNIDNVYLKDNPEQQVVSISEDSFSPKLGVIYQIDAESQLYAQYVRGFRAPPFEDANIGLDIPMFKMRAIPNPDLKSETTNGYEIGYNYKSEQHQIDLIAFYNDYDDFIQTKINLGFDPMIGRVIFQSQNIENSKIYGAEFSYKGHFDNIISKQDSLLTYVNLFWSKGKNRDLNVSINEIEPNHAVLGARWLSPNEQLSLAINANIVDKKSDLDDEHLDTPLATTSGYMTIDLIANYHFNDKLTIAAAINNITDKQYWHWSSVNGFAKGDPLLDTIVAPGINGSLQLKYAF